MKVIAVEYFTNSIDPGINEKAKFDSYISELIVTWQIGRELHDTDSSGTAHTVVRYGTQLISSTTSHSFHVRSYVNDR